MAEYYSNLAKDTDLQIQEAEWPPDCVNLKKSMS